MIPGERLEVIVVPQIRPAVADVDDAGNLVLNPRADDGRSHLSLRGLALRLTVDDGIRSPHGIGQTRRLREKTAAVVLRTPVAIGRGPTGAIPIAHDSTVPTATATIPPGTRPLNRTRPK